MARKAVVSERAMVALYQSRKPLTAKEMGVSAVIAGRLREVGAIEHVDVRHKPSRGRPEFLYRLADEQRAELRKQRRRKTTA
jgi:predicted ArsR family transcriptional regulator